MSSFSDRFEGFKPRGKLYHSLEEYRRARELEKEAEKQYADNEAKEYIVLCSLHRVKPKQAIIKSIQEGKCKLEHVEIVMVKGRKISIIKKR